MSSIIHAENLRCMQSFCDCSFDFVYTDPPFNTGKKRKLHDKFYLDSFDNFQDFIKPRIEQVHRLLKPDGSLFFHIDYREAHYCKVLLDSIFGRESFMNEIVWAYDYGGRSKNKWSSKHDTIFWYSKNPHKYTFNFEEMERIPYMAPGLVGKEKAERGKTPTDVWWHTIVHTRGAERTGYPTQKPIGILLRILKVHTKPGDKILDPFAGSGTTGEAATILGRECVLIDSNPQAVEVMRKRLPSFKNHL